jgi:cytochrome c-type biogenesis protein CcmE
MNAKLIIGLLLIASFMGLGVFSFVDNQVASVSIAVARDSNETVQVQGVVDFETVNYDVEKKQMTFDLLEKSETSNAVAETPERMTIIYPGEIPGNFDQATSVTVIGVSGPEGFLAENMLVKCPSKYQGEGGEEEVDPEDMEVRTYSPPS